MTTANQIPFQQQSQQMQITLGSIAYNLRMQWNVPNQTWMLDILNQDGNQIISGMAVVTGEDLLAAFEYLEIGGALDAGQLQAQTTSDTFEPPTYENLGTDGNVYWVTEP